MQHKKSMCVRFLKYLYRPSVSCTGPQCCRQHTVAYSRCSGVAGHCKDMRLSSLFVLYILDSIFTLCPLSCLMVL